MSETIKGYVIKKLSRDRKGKRPPFRPYKTWSIRLADEAGEEFPDWIGFGFNEPQAEEGQYVEVKIEREGDYVNAVKDSIRVVDEPVRRDNRNDSSRAQPAASDGDSDGGDVASRQTQIVLQHSQEMAIATVALLLNNKALPVAAANTKAGEAKRFEEIMAAIDKLTVQYTIDVFTGRLLDVVADAGADRVSTKADGPIPPVAEESTSDPSLDD